MTMPYLISSTLKAVWLFLGTTAPGFFLVPLVAAILTFSQSAGKFVTRFGRSFQNAALASLLVFLAVFAWKAVAVGAYFWNPQLDFHSYSPPQPMPSPPTSAERHFDTHHRFSPLPPANPIIVKSTVVSGDIEAGGFVELTIAFQNVSGRALSVIDAKVAGLGPLYKDANTQQRFEEAFWESVLTKIDRENVYQLPASSTGFYRKMKSHRPLTASEATALIKGGLATYFAVVIRDSSTQKTLLEFCGYAAENPEITMCHRHNWP